MCTGWLVQNILGSVHHTGGLQQLSPWLKINEVDHKKLKEVLSECRESNDVMPNRVVPSVTMYLIHMLYREAPGLVVRFHLDLIDIPQEDILLPPLAAGGFNNRDIPLRQQPGSEDSTGEGSLKGEIIKTSFKQIILHSFLFQMLKINYVQYSTVSNHMMYS